MKIKIDNETVECVQSGEGQPVIVLLNGHNSPLTFWKEVFPKIEQLGRVLRYNRLIVAAVIVRECNKMVK